MTEPTPLTGEPLAIDLVNTRVAVEDLLSTPRHLRRWLDLEAERLENPAGHRVDHDLLAAVRTVRSHAAACFEALLDHRPPPSTALRGLAEAANAVPPRIRLDWDDDGFTATTTRDGTAAHRLVAELADSAIRTLTDRRAMKRLRRCAADDCVMIFVPAHARRRWCSATGCGNRARVARYYERHKPDRQPG